MIRVTELLPVVWPAGFAMRHSTPTDAEALTALFYQCNGGGTEQHPAYPVLRLFVRVSNPAEAVYRNLGFVARPESYWLKQEIESGN